MVFIGNTVGAIGDIWMASCLVRFRGLQAVTVVDLADGIAIYTPDAKADEIAQRLSAHDKRGPGFVVQWIGAAAARCSPPSCSPDSSARSLPTAC